MTFVRLWIEDDNSHNVNQRSLPAVQSESQQEEKVIVAVLYNVIIYIGIQGAS